VVERKDDRAKEAAGALQEEFTTGPVHEHVKVGPEAHGWLPSRMSSTCVNSYARVWVIYVCMERWQGPWNQPKSSVGAHCTSL